MNKFHVNVAQEDEPYEAEIYCKNERLARRALDSPDSDGPDLAYTVNGVRFNDGTSSLTSVPSESSSTLPSSLPISTPSEPTSKSPSESPSEPTSEPTSFPTSDSTSEPTSEPTSETTSETTSEPTN